MSNCNNRPHFLPAFNPSWVVCSACPWTNRVRRVMNYQTFVEGMRESPKLHNIRPLERFFIFMWAKVFNEWNMHRFYLRLLHWHSLFTESSPSGKLCDPSSIICVQLCLEFIFFFLGGGSSPHLISPNLPASLYVVLGVVLCSASWATSVGRKKVKV